MQNSRFKYLSKLLYRYFLRASSIFLQSSSNLLEPTETYFKGTRKIEKHFFNGDVEDDTVAVSKKIKLTHFKLSFLFLSFSNFFIVNASYKEIFVTLFRVKKSETRLQDLTRN